MDNSDKSVLKKLNHKGQWEERWINLMFFYMNIFFYYFHLSRVLMFISIPYSTVDKNQKNLHMKPEDGQWFWTRQVCRSYTNSIMPAHLLETTLEVQSKFSFFTCLTPEKAIHSTSHLLLSLHHQLWLKKKLVRAEVERRMKAESNLCFTSALPMAYGTVWCNKANGFLVFDPSIIAIVWLWTL